MSDWKERSNRRRDERNTKVDDEPHKTKRSKKDTIRWCKGKIGREHTPKCMPHKPMIIGNSKNIFADWKEYVCTACGKVLDRWYPIRFTSGMDMNDGTEKPEWVKDE